MISKLRRQLQKRKAQTHERVDPINWSGQSPMIDPPAIRYELSEKQQAISAGGIGVVLEAIKTLGVREAINEHLTLLKLHLPYDEADHVLNIALNLLAGGTCLDHLEEIRNDQAWLNAFGAQRIPDPTTAGDFCRRFHQQDILQLQQGFNQIRRIAWQQQPDDFFEQAVIEADGSMVETCGEKKQGIGMNYKKQWGYHPLLISLANTNEPLYIVNRSGNRPSHEHSGLFFDMAIEQCRTAGFRSVLLRGDTDFALTENFDRWSEDGVEFVFGIDAMPKLVGIADDLEKDCWKRLTRQRSSSGKPRAKGPNHKQAVVQEKGYQNKRLKGEWVAEFDYQPGQCSRTYRVIVLRKEVEVTSGQQKLFDDEPYFFYITNIPKAKQSARQIVSQANQRCDQENLISQLKASGAFTAPLDNLHSNWAYMVIASLAWSLKIWCGLLIRAEHVEDVGKQQASSLKATKREIIRMEFRTFCQRLLNIPAQIIQQARGLTYRLLSYRESVEVLFLLHHHVRQPLRC